MLRTLAATLRTFWVVTAACDLPVQKINQGVLPQREEPSEHWHWAESYGFSAAQWDEMVNGSKVTEEYLKLLIEKGQRDWESELLAEHHVSLRRSLRAKQRVAVQRVMELVQTNDRLGQMFGNRQILEATSSYYLLGNDVPPDMLPFHEELQSLQSLERAFGIFNVRSKRYKGCLLVAPSTKLEAHCNCWEFWSCAATNGAPFVARVTLHPPERRPNTTELAPLRGVRIVETSGGGVFQEAFVQTLVKLFPNLRVLKVNMVSDDLVLYPQLHSWSSSILALHLHAPTSGPMVQMLCQLRKLRYLTFGGAEASDRTESLMAFPACMGNLSELVHVKVVGCNLTGSASLPSTLSNLKELKVFEAFEQGRLNADDEAACPGDWLPNRTDCVPGYVARADAPESPVWRCPVHGWNLQMDDMTLPWWNWQSLEKMHIDANFIYGTIPEQLPELWPHLRSLDLHDLKLSGALPLSLTTLENLTQLQVQLNDLQCPEGVDVIAALMKRPKMRVLHVDANPRMCGCLPPEAPHFLHLSVGETSIRLNCDEHLEL